MCEIYIYVQFISNDEDTYLQYDKENDSLKYELKYMPNSAYFGRQIRNIM